MVSELHDTIAYFVMIASVLDWGKHIIVKYGIPCDYLKSETSLLPIQKKKVTQAQSDSCFEMGLYRHQLQVSDDHEIKYGILSYVSNVSEN